MNCDVLNGLGLCALINSLKYCVQGVQRGNTVYVVLTTKYERFYGVDNA